MQLNGKLNGKSPTQNTTNPRPRSWTRNSPNVIHRRYKALVKEADAKEFWEITPENVAQIIPFPATAAAAK